MHPVLLPSDVFDQPQPVGNKKIEFNISTNMPAAFKNDLEKEQNNEEKNSGKKTYYLFIIYLFHTLGNHFYVKIKFYSSVCLLYLKYTVTDWGGSSVGREHA